MRLRPTGGNDYLVVLGRRPVATAQFSRYRTGEGFRAEARVEPPGSEPTELSSARYDECSRQADIQSSSGGALGEHINSSRRTAERGRSVILPEAHEIQPRDCPEEPLGGGDGQVGEAAT